MAIKLVKKVFQDPSHILVEQGLQKLHLLGNNSCKSFIPSLHLLSRLCDYRRWGVVSSLASATTDVEVPSPLSPLRLPTPGRHLLYTARLRAYRRVVIFSSDGKNPSLLYVARLRAYRRVVAFSSDGKSPSLLCAARLHACRRVIAFSSDGKNPSLILPVRSSHCCLLCVADGTNPSPCTSSLLHPKSLCHFAQILAPLRSPKSLLPLCPKFLLLFTTLSPVFTSSCSPLLIPLQWWHLKYKKMSVDKSLDRFVDY
ncbi:hypothetical protein ACLOJK_032163 [Asimina triloba]